MKMHIKHLKPILALTVCVISIATVLADELEPKPDAKYFEKFEPIKAPTYRGLYLKNGDTVAICGDSITEQKMYSRILETYLTVCYPNLKLNVRQFGWSGETAQGFLRRMTNDCLRFKPTLATLCYGMNDFKYRPYDEPNAQWYKSNYTAVVRAFKSAGARVIVGSPGCVGKVASWVKGNAGTVEDHNLSLCAFRNIDINIAKQENVRFADVFWPMFVSSFYGKIQFGPGFELSGKDGVHPGWAGHLVMAYCFLKAMGVDGEIGTISVDLQHKKARASQGHQIQKFDGRTLTLTSYRYPFCAEDRPNKDDSIRAGMDLVTFNQEFNRFILKVNGVKSELVKITWGNQSKVYSSAELTKGVNLANDFVVNPFLAQFKMVDEAVAAKQAFETKQIKELFHSPAAKTNMNNIVSTSEAERSRLVKNIENAFVPITHTIIIDPI
jgi:lysophospholipase L1-like esterase